MGKINKEQLVVRKYESNIEYLKTLENSEVYHLLSEALRISPRTVRNHLSRNEKFLRINNLKKEYGIKNNTTGRKSKENIVRQCYESNTYAKASEIAKICEVSKPTVLKYLKKFKKEEN